MRNPSSERRTTRLIRMPMFIGVLAIALFALRAWPAHFLWLTCEHEKRSKPVVRAFSE